MVTSKASDEHADFSCDQCFDLSRFCCDKILTFAFHYNRRYFSITQGSAGRLGCKRIRKSVVNSSRKSLQETHFSETISCRNNGHGPRQCNKADGDNFKIVSDFTITCPLTPLSGVRAVSMIILHASGFPLQSDSNFIPLKKIATSKIFPQNVNGETTLQYFSVDNKFANCLIQGLNQSK